MLYITTGPYVLAEPEIEIVPPLLL